MNDPAVTPDMFVPSYVMDKVIDVAALRPDQVFVEDIADTLSKGCRFSGRCPYPYSVAQHTVLVAALLEHVNLAYEGLHHDDTEAYIGDIIGPFKGRLRVLYPDDMLQRVSDFEAKIRMQAIAPALKLDLIEPAQVKAADLHALLLEQHYLQGRTEVPAQIPEGWTVDRVRWYLRPLHWRRARENYLAKHFELYPEDPCSP